MERSVKTWLPIESNPQVFTPFAEKIGFPTIMFSFHDVLGLDADSWAISVPQPVIAVVLVYKFKPIHHEFIHNIEKEQIESKEDKPFFIK